MLATITEPNYAAIKQRQQATWATGDYAMIGTTLQIVGERLCEAVDLRAGERVLDVAAGNGNATLAAARHFAQVTSTDYVGELLERGKERAAAERLTVTFQTADAEALPFADNSFDVALSTFGVMFTPDQAKAAAELTRTVRKGGRVGLSWDVYRQRYLTEMLRQKERIKVLADRVRSGETLTLLCSSQCTREDRCHRSLLKQLIEREMG